MIELFILIYLVSLVIHLVICYKENKRHIFYVRDLLDEIDFYMWFPILNTLLILVVLICIVIMTLWEVSDLLKRFIKNRVMALWIARDLDGELKLYDNQPMIINEWFVPQRGFDSLELDEQLFPEVTFENSPQEIEIKLM